jgi:hypothetical protein
LLEYRAVILESDVAGTGFSLHLFKQTRNVCGTPPPAESPLGLI